MSQLQWNWFHSIPRTLIFEHFLSLGSLLDHLSRVVRGVYKPCFLVVDLEIVQAVQDLIYVLISCRILANRNVFVALPLSFRHRTVLPPDSSELPRSTSLARLMEHRYGLEDTKKHLEDENYRQLCLHPTFGRWW
jgi:hypothetical protein